MGTFKRSYNIIVRSGVRCTDIATGRVVKMGKGIRMWWRKALDREEWRKLLMEANTLEL
jgi:hypothetical protein